MFGTAQPVPQRLDLRTLALTTGLGAIVLAATIALGAISAAINGSTPIVTAPAAPAALTAPAIRDLGSRDVVVSSPFHPGGFGPGVDQRRDHSNDSGQAAPAGRPAGLWAQ